VAIESSYQTLSLVAAVALASLFGQKPLAPKMDFVKLFKAQSVEEARTVLDAGGVRTLRALPLDYLFMFLVATLTMGMYWFPHWPVAEIPPEAR
jgi:hypothetical protein